MYFRGSQVTHEEACGKSHTTELGRRARTVTMKLRTNRTSVYKRPEKENSHSQPLLSVLFEGWAWQCLIHQELCHYRTLQWCEVTAAARCSGKFTVRSVNAGIFKSTHLQS